MRTTRFIDVLATACFFMIPLVIGTDVVSLSLVDDVGDGGDEQGESLRWVVHDQVKVRKKSKDVANDIDESHQGDLGVAPDHVNPRDGALTSPVVATTITKPCSSSSISSSPLSPIQQYQGPPSSSSLMSTSMMTSTRPGNITIAAAETTATTTRCTPISWTNTFAFTSDATCPTPYEMGTYCGFVNPEDPCAKQPGGYGPRIHPDTPEAFLNHTPFHEAALRAATPPGYNLTFRDLYAAANAPPHAYHEKGRSNVSSSSSSTTTPCYMGYHLLTSYDAPACANLCESDPSGACAAFNLYVERDPEWNPWRCSCDRPRAVTNYKCALFSGPEAVEDFGRATNFGQYIQGSSFVRKIVGSNGYAKIGGGRRVGAGACQGRVATAMTAGGSGSGTASAGVLALSSPSTGTATSPPYLAAFVGSSGAAAHDFCNNAHDCIIY
ncbi:subtilisin-like serine protease [Apiospora arundinis]